MVAKKPDTAWPLPRVRPEEVGLSSERLGRIRPALQGFIEKGMAPNFVTLVARHGKLVHYEAQGYLDFQSCRPATVDTIYRLWSNTKPITGVATMICVEEGLLDLDDPISKYVPGFKNQRVRATAAPGAMMRTPTVPVAREVTVRDCLRNTTGITTARRAPLAYLNEFRDIVMKAGLLTPLEELPTLNLREMVDALGQLPLEAQPGTQFEYQVGYPVIGVVIETVTGQTLEEFYQKRIFKPLGMKDSSFYLDREKIDRFPTLYRPVFDGGKWQLAVAEEPEKSEKVTGPRKFFEAGGGGGGVLATAGDYARFAQMLLNGGELDGVRILSRKSVEIMTSSQTGDIVLSIPGPGFGFGLGLGVYQGGGRHSPIYRSIGTYGWGGAAGTTYFADPKEGIIAICFSQVFMNLVMGDRNYQDVFERLVYQALL